MGFSHSFIAVRGADRAAVLEHLGLAETGRTGDIDLMLNGFAIAELKGGWLLVGGDDIEFPARAALAALSQGAEVVSCFIEEHVMVSEARGFSGGAQTWRVTHDPDKGDSDLQVEGTPPPSFATIRDKHVAEQAKEESKGVSVDIVFDAPPRLAESVCGFFIGESEGDLAGLSRPGRSKAASGAGKPGFFARLLGRA